MLLAISSAISLQSLEDKEVLADQEVPPDVPVSLVSLSASISRASSCTVYLRPVMMRAREDSLALIWMSIRATASPTWLIILIAFSM